MIGPELVELVGDDYGGCSADCVRCGEQVTYCGGGERLADVIAAAAGHECGARALAAYEAKLAVEHERAAFLDELHRVPPMGER